MLGCTWSIPRLIAELNFVWTEKYKTSPEQVNCIDFSTSRKVDMIETTLFSIRIGNEKEQTSQDTTLTSSSGQGGSQEVVELSGSTFYRGPKQKLDTTTSMKALQVIVFSLLLVHCFVSRFSNI